MALYLVERKLIEISIEISIEQLVTAQHAAVEMSRRFTAEGKPARYIRTTLAPSELRSLTLFEAANAKVVQEVNEAAQIPFDRILEALDLIP